MKRFLAHCTAKLLPLFGFLGLAAGCSAAELTGEEKLARIEAMIVDYKREFPEVEGLDATGVEAALAAGAVLVDVRSAGERATSMIAGAVSREEFEARAEEFAGSTLVTYCTIGYRSSEYAEKLLADGWDVKNFDGSLLAWTHAGGELVDADGRPTKRLDVYGSRWDLAAEDYTTSW